MAVEYSDLRHCERCGKPINPRRGRAARFCVDKCPTELVRAQKRRTWLNSSPGVQLDTGKVGAIGELLVSVDLLSKGYVVFRALSSSAPCDLAILRGTKCLRIEVKTGSFKDDGTLNFPKVGTERTDVVAVVVHGMSGHQIRYLPELPPPE